MFWSIFAYTSALLFSNLTMFPCVMLTLFCYFRILKIVRRHHLQIQSQAVSSLNEGRIMQNFARYQKSVINMLYIVGFFLFSYIPWITSIVVFIAVGKPITTVIYVCQTLLFINSSLNPVLYCWRMQEIRQSMKETLSGIFALVIR